MAFIFIIKVSFYFLWESDDEEFVKDSEDVGTFGI